MRWYVVVNENFKDAGAWVLSDAATFPLGGWERLWSAHATRAEAEAALPEALAYAQGRRG